MKPPRIVILGAGIAGLAASHVLKRKGLHPLLLEQGHPGGEFLAGGPRVLRDTKSMRCFLADLNLPHSKFTTRQGMLLRGRVEPFPRCLKNRLDARRVHADYWTKSRRVLPDDPTARYLTGARNPRKGFLRCDLEELVAKLASRARIQTVRVLGIERNHIETSGGRVPFELALCTLPLWELTGKTWFGLPSGVAVKLCATYVIPFHDRFARWDTVLAPYTPAACVHRMLSFEDGWVVEAAGEPSLADLESDLHWLFPEGYFVQWQRRGLKGALLPLEEDAAWPPNVRPLGRFAQWDSEVTVAEVVERIEGEVAYAHP